MMEMTMTKNKKVPVLRFREFEGEWNVYKLAEVAKKIQDGTHFSPTVLEEGNYKYVTSKNIRNGFLKLDTVEYISKEDHEGIYKRCDVKFGDILLTKDGASTGNVCINSLKEEFSLLSSVAFLRANTNLVTSDFLFQSILSPRGQKEIRISISGQAITRITLTKIRGYKLYFPNLTEQQKIATFLTAIDHRIQLFQQKKDKLEDYKKGVMQKLFSQELRFRDEDGEAFGDWEERKLGEVATFRRGSFPQPYGLPQWYDEINGMPFVQVFDVDSNFKLKTTTKQKISDLAKPKSVFVGKGNIVLTIQGSIGRIAITQYDCYVDRTLLIFQSFTAPINKKFFAYIIYLLFDIEKKKAPGGIIKTITKDKLKDFNILLPTLPEQKKIATFLMSLDAGIEKIGHQIKGMEGYKKGLLQKMFV